jgi:hypothetical protein
MRESQEFEYAASDVDAVIEDLLEATMIDPFLISTGVEMNRHGILVRESNAKKVFVVLCVLAQDSVRHLRVWASE